MEQISLYILLIAALTAVAGLSVALYRCRRRLAQCQRVMVRCINENLDMKENTSFPTSSTGRRSLPKNLPESFTTC